MKYSIAVSSCTPAGYPAIYNADLFGGIRKAHEFGYSGIEWHLRKPDFDEAKRVKTLCSKADLPVNAIGTGLACGYDSLSLMSDDPAVRAQAIIRLREFIDLGEYLGSKIIIGSMKGKIPQAEDYEKHEAYCITGLKTIMEYAEQKNVMVVLEAINRYETNFLNTAGQANDFTKKIGSKLLKVHIDTFHMNIEEPNICESIEKYGDIIGHVHFADSNRWYPGAGHIDFMAVLNSLDKIGYQGYAAMECLPHPEPDIAAKHGIEYLRSL